MSSAVSRLPENKRPGGCEPPGPLRLRRLFELGRQATNTARPRAREAPRVRQQQQVANRIITSASIPTGPRQCQAVSLTTPQRSQLVAQLRDPFPPRALPAHASEVYLAVAIEADALALEELALRVGPEAVAMAAATRRIDDALPGNQVEQWALQRTEGHSHRPRAARLPKDCGNLPVGHHPTAGDAAHQAIDQAVEGRRARRPAGPPRTGRRRTAAHRRRAHVLPRARPSPPRD